MLPLSSGPDSLIACFSQAGVLDQAGAARIVLRDWSVGKFPRFTPAPAVSEAFVLARPTSSLAELYNEDEKIFSTLEARKEMRKRIGLVKLTACHIDVRKIDVEARWAGLEQDGDDKSEEEQEECDKQDGSDSEDDNVDVDEHNDSEDDDEPAPAPASKRKRRNISAAPSTRPNKKVAFAPDPKESRRARAAGSAKATPLSLSSKPVSSKMKPLKPANISTKTASQKSTVSLDKGGEEAYDFGKFF